VGHGIVLSMCVHGQARAGSQQRGGSGADTRIEQWEFRCALSIMSAPRTVVLGVICWIHMFYSGSHRNLDTQLTEDGDICKPECLTQQNMSRTYARFLALLVPLDQLQTYISTYVAASAGRKNYQTRHSRSNNRVQ